MGAGFHPEPKGCGPVYLLMPRPTPTDTRNAVTADLRTLYNAKFYRTSNAGAGSSARACAPLIAELLRPASAVDVGCGQGEWLAALVTQGVADVQGIDGGHVTDEQLIISPDRFTRHDLTQPLNVSRRFDVALSLEVAEHLPARRAPGFVADLVRLAPAVVFSAAVPGQGGIHHVNEQWPWYWQELFAGHGYVRLDPFRHVIWKHPDVAVYYQHNLFLFVDPTTHRALIERVGVADRRTELTLVRTVILQELTRPSLLTRALRRLGRIFSSPLAKAPGGKEQSHE